ncbi:hypothetical protein ADUPG1_004207, partial [Aduncisulcus paluster]
KREVSVLVDTGSTYNVADETIIMELGIPASSLIPTDICLELGDGTDISIKYAVILKVSVEHAALGKQMEFDDEFLIMRSKKPQYILGFKTSLEKGLIDHLISEYVDFPQSMTSYEVDLEEKELMEKTKPPPNNVTFVEGFMVNEEFKEELKLVLQDYKRKNKKEYGKHTIPLEIT